MENLELKHSAGPWAVGCVRSDTTEGENAFKYTSCYIKNANGLVVADVMGIDKATNTWTHIDHVVPNAHLIAAAPLLLSALMEAVKIAEDQSVGDYCLANNIPSDIVLSGIPPEYYPSWYDAAMAAIAQALNLAK